MPAMDLTVSPRSFGLGPSERNRYPELAATTFQNMGDLIDASFVSVKRAAAKLAAIRTATKRKLILRSSLLILCHISLV
jgi:hypothetical protein